MAPPKLYRQGITGLWRRVAIALKAGATTEAAIIRAVFEEEPNDSAIAAAKRAIREMRAHHLINLNAAGLVLTRLGLRQLSLTPRYIDTGAVFEGHG